MKTCRKGLHQYSEKRNRCPECHKIKMNSLYQEKKAEYSARMKAWKQANPLYKSKCKVGNELFDYKSMLQSQNGVCKICLNASTISLAVDHDHVTGKIRGLLCHNCNVGLGHFKDNIDLLNVAIKYLENSKCE